MNNEQITVLVIEDEPDIRTLIKMHLHKDGYAVVDAPDGETGLRLFAARKPQLVLLDLMLPGMDGVAVCRKIRQHPELKNTPVLMLTARGEESDIVLGLESGADDYIVKPFSNRVLLARIRSLLRRSGFSVDGQDAEKQLTVGTITLKPETREVTAAGRKIDLTAGEYKLLKTLMRRPGVVFTRNQLLDLVRGTLHAVTDRAVDVQIVGLRKKLGEAGKSIETVRGAGYRISVAD